MEGYGSRRKRRRWGKKKIDSGNFVLLHPEARRREQNLNSCYNPLALNLKGETLELQKPKKKRNPATTVNVIEAADMVWPDQSEMSQADRKKFYDDREYSGADDDEEGSKAGVPDKHVVESEDEVDDDDEEEDDEVSDSSDGSSDDDE